MGVSRFLVGNGCLSLSLLVDSKMFFMDLIWSEFSVWVGSGLRVSLLGRVLLLSLFDDS